MAISGSILTLASKYRSLQKQKNEIQLWVLVFHTQGRKGKIIKNLNKV